MTIEVIGAGFGRTGTLSLKFALEKLGYDKCYHMMEVQHNPGHLQQWIDAADGNELDWPGLFKGYKASVDWPSCNFWREQMAAFPNAKVILSRRDADAWHKSVMNTIWPASKAGGQNPDAKAQLGWKMAREVIWDGVFAGRIEDRDYAIECFERHNQTVIDSVPADNLLVYQPGDGWQPLCDFLGCDVPDEPYPRTNTTEEFKTLWEKIAKEKRNDT